MIQKTLNAIGVKYSHHNDEILVPSRIEEERTKTLLVCRIVVRATAHGLNVFIENSAAKVSTLVFEELAQPQSRMAA